MASGLYNLTKDVWLTTGLNLLTLQVDGILIDSGNYTVNFNTDEFYDPAVPGAARVGTDQTLASKTVNLGTFDAADITFPTVTGSTVEAILLRQNTGTETTSRLQVYIDNAVQFPVTPNGGDITVTWNASGIFNW